MIGTAELQWPSMGAWHSVNKIEAQQQIFIAQGSKLEVVLWPEATKCDPSVHNESHVGKIQHRVDGTIE